MLCVSDDMRMCFGVSFTSAKQILWAIKSTGQKYHSENHNVSVKQLKIHLRSNKYAEAINTILLRDLPSTVPKQCCHKIL